MMEWLTQEDFLAWHKWVSSWTVLCLEYLHTWTCSCKTWDILLFPRQEYLLILLELQIFSDLWQLLHVRFLTLHSTNLIHSHSWKSCFFQLSIFAKRIGGLEITDQRLTFFRNVIAFSGIEFNPHSIPEGQTQFLRVKLNSWGSNSIPEDQTQFLRVKLNSWGSNSIPEGQTQFLTDKLNSWLTNSIPEGQTQFLRVKLHS